MENRIRSAPTRSCVGGTDRKACTDANNPNVVTLIFEAEDLQRAEAFSQSDELREAMQRVGVVGKPDIYFLKG
jgi:hypothetical protein